MRRALREGRKAEAPQPTPRGLSLTQVQPEVARLPGRGAGAGWQSAQCQEDGPLAKGPGRLFLNIHSLCLLIVSGKGDVRQR